MQVICVIIETERAYFARFWQRFRLFFGPRKMKTNNRDKHDTKEKPGKKRKSVCCFQEKHYRDSKKKDVYKNHN